MYADRARTVRGTVPTWYYQENQDPISNAHSFRHAFRTHYGNLTAAFTQPYLSRISTSDINFDPLISPIDIKAMICFKVANYPSITRP